MTDPRSDEEVDDEEEEEKCSTQYSTWIANVLEIIVMTLAIE